MQSLLWADAGRAAGGGSPWRFARHATVLAEVTGTAADAGSLGRWAHAHALPVDLMQALRPSDGPLSADGLYPYELSGDRLHADVAPAVLHYIRRVDDPSKFPPLFLEALSCDPRRGWPCR